jgi:hypothetical protein
LLHTFTMRFHLIGNSKSSTKIIINTLSSFHSKKLKFSPQCL